jgi:hypothetical protein
LIALSKDESLGFLTSSFNVDVLRLGAVHFWEECIAADGVETLGEARERRASAMSNYSEAESVHENKADKEERFKCLKFRESLLGRSHGDLI